MKNFKIILLLIISFSFFYCQDVIDVPLNTSASRIVIDASLKWNKGTTGNVQTIRITKTGDFYGTTVPVVNGAIVKVTNAANVVFNFVETPGTGNYVCNNFVPVINETYTLEINAEGQVFKGTEKLIAMPTITNIQQEDNFGPNNNAFKFRFNFQDNPGERNFYLEEYYLPNKPKPEFGIFDDEFTNGNLMFAILISDDIKKNEVLNYSFQGVSERYAKYVEVLVGLAGGQNNGPFATSPVSIRGNIINQTNDNNYPFGYFRLSETVTSTYTVQ